MANLKGAGRPSEHFISRLSYRVWAVLLRDAANTAEIAAGAKPITSWAQLEHRLVSLQLQGSTGMQPDAKGLRGVAARGVDPHMLEWRIDADEPVDAELQQLRVVTRHVSGGWKEKVPRPQHRYRRLSFDAVALGEYLIPGSSRWLDKTLWWLVATRNPTIDQVRNCIASSLHSLGLVRPTLSERRRCMDEAAFQAALIAPRNEVLSSYRFALDKLSQEITPELIALLIALVKESYLTSDDDLYDLHREVLCSVLDRWLSSPAFTQSLTQELRQNVVYPVLVGEPIQNLPPTDPRDVPMTKVEWIAAVRTACSSLGDPVEIPFLPSDAAKQR